VRDTTRILLLSLLASFLLLPGGMTWAIGPETSGSWFNPQQDGHGFSIEYVVLDDGTRTILAYWYVYDADGNPLFMVGQGVVEAGNAVTVRFQAPFGMRYGEFDPGQVVRQDAGTGRFEFEDSKTGTFSYQPTTDMVDRYGLSPLTIPVVQLVAVTLEEPSECDTVLESWAGSWSGRIMVDERSSGACHDADLYLSVSESLDGPFVGQAGGWTVLPDTGGIGLDGGGARLWENGFLSATLDLFGERVDVNLQFPPLGTAGHAEGHWAVEGGGECFGTVILRKD
jgi:hypothetical protein